jgi:WD40 repeat protein
MQTLKCHRSVLALVMMWLLAAASGQAPKTALPTIVPEPLALKSGAPLSGRTLVARPPFLKGVRSWTLESRRHRGYLVAAAVSPDGKSLATGGLDGIVRIWDLETGNLTRVLVGHESYVYGLGWSPDGRYLVSGGSFDATARLWDARNGMPLRVLRGHKGYVVQVAWSPDGETVAVAGGQSGFVTFWNAIDGRELRTIENGKPVNGMAWSPDGKLLACGGSEFGVMIWSAGGKKIANWKPEGGDGFGVAWSADGKRLAVGGKMDASLWEVEGTKKLRSFAGAANTVTFSSDGKALATAGAAVVLWEVESGKQVGSIPAAANMVRLLPGGEQLVCAHSAGAGVWAIAGPRLVRDMDLTAMVPLTWRPGRPTLAIFGGTQPMLWDTATCKPMHALPPLASPASATSLSPDGKQLACACADGKVRLLNVAAGKELSPLEGHKGAVTAVAWSPDGKQLASGGADKTVRVWSPGFDKASRVLEAHEEAVTVLAWSAGGSLASGTPGPVVHLSLVATGRLLRALREQPAAMSLAWSHDGRLLAVGGNDDNAYVYTVASGKLLHVLESPGSPRSVTGLAFSPDNTILASGRDNHTLQLWNMKTGKQVHYLPTMAPVLYVSWPLGSSTMAAGTTDGAVRFWDSVPGRPRAALLLQGRQLVAVSAEGHYRAPPGEEPELVYVALEERAMHTLTPKEFAAKYGWKNNPAAVRLTGN